MEKKVNNENILLKVDFGRDATGIANILKYIDDQINSNSFFDGGLKLDHLSHDDIKSLIVGDKTIEKKILEADHTMLDPKDLGELFERLEEQNPILKMQAMLKSYLTKRTEQKRWGLSKKWSMQEKK